MALLIYMAPLNTYAQIKAETMLKDFYRAVSYVWTFEPPESIGKKLDSIARKYCTQELRLKAKKIYETQGFDLLTNENPYKIIPPESLTVTTAIHPNTYIISYKSVYDDGSDKGIPTSVTLHMIVTKCKDGYRISEIK